MTIFVTFEEKQYPVDICHDMYIKDIFDFLPERCNNLLFQGEELDSDLLIADSGLSSEVILEGTHVYSIRDYIDDYPRYLVSNINDLCEKCLNHKVKIDTKRDFIIFPPKDHTCNKKNIMRDKELILG